MSHLFLPLIDNGMGLSRTSFTFSMIHAALTVLREHKVDLQRVSYPYPDGAWNIAVQYFLESDAEEIVKIDTDIKFEPEDLSRLMSHDEPIVFGLYPLKKVGLEFPAIGLDDGVYPFADDGRPDLREVSQCAGGFVRIHRSVFEKLKPFVDCITSAENQRPQWIFFKNLPGGHSEDFSFCNLARLHGYKILVDRRITTIHDGSAEYPIKGTY